MALQEEDEERTQSGGCFIPALRSLFDSIREMIRKRRVKQRRRNYRIAKMQEEERVGRERDAAKEKECSVAGLSNSNADRLEQRVCLSSGLQINGKSPDEEVTGIVELQPELQRQVSTPQASRKRKANSSREEEKPASKRGCPEPCPSRLRTVEPPRRRGEQTWCKNAQMSLLLSAHRIVDQEITCKQSKALHTLSGLHPNILCFTEFGACYKRGKRLGQGGFGSVYAGTRKEDGAQVRLPSLPHFPI